MIFFFRIFEKRPHEGTSIFQEKVTKNETSLVIRKNSEAMIWNFTPPPAHPSANEYLYLPEDTLYKIVSNEKHRIREFLRFRERQSST